MKTVMMFLVILGITVNIALADIEQHKIGDGPHGGNCVFYARTLVPSLPHNLTSFKNKLNIINKNKPKKGYVAIIDVGNDIGHVAVVMKVDDDGKNQGITIQEANFPRQGVWKRKAKAKSIKKAEKELRIVGYYKP